LAQTTIRAGERRENLVRAGALILAEIDRLDRISPEAEWGR
jgi:hypothetical protein